MQFDRPLLILLSVCALAWFAGCAPEIPASFTPREELQKLPKKHREPIELELKKYFGTASVPQFLELAPTEQQPSEGDPLFKAKHDVNHLLRGRAVYLQQCAGCHGVTGDGQGPAAQFLDPRPRDYRLGKFKFISTPRGSKPRRADLERILRRGAKGTSMPAFRWMPKDELDAVIDYVMLLSSRGELEYRLGQVVQNELSPEDDPDPEVAKEAAKEEALFITGQASEQTQLIAAGWTEADGQIVRPLTPELTSTPATVEAGAQAFVRLNCYKCHGSDGRGNKSANTFKDDWGRTAIAADLTAGTLHGGARPIDLYRRIYAGINGTPMPAFAQPDVNQGETEAQRSETIWHLTHFIQHIAKGNLVPREVIDAEIRKQQSQATTPGAEASEPPKTTEAPSADN